MATGLATGLPWIFMSCTEKNLTFASPVLGHLQILRGTLECWAWWVCRVLDSNARHTSCTEQERKLPGAKFCGYTAVIIGTSSIIWKKKTKIKILQQGKEEMGKEQKRQTKVLVAPVCLAKKRLISRGGRISGLMWTLILKQCVFIAGDHKT